MIEKFIVILSSLVLLFGSYDAVAHETILEEEILYLETSHPIESEAHYNWFERSAEVHNGAVQALLEPLFFIDEDTGLLVGWLAESSGGENLFSDDFTEIEITLRRTARWSDGSPFTAHDVVFSLSFPEGKQGLDAPHVAAVQAALSDVVALDDRRLRIILNAPDQFFLHRHFAAIDGISYPIVPKHVWAGAVTIEDMRDLPPLGTGPYEMVNRDPGHRVTWERHQWWGTSEGWMPPPQPHRIHWHITGPLEQRAPSLVRATSDSIRPVLANVADGLMAISETTTTWSGTNPEGTDQACGYSAYLNPPPSTDDQRMRTALFALIDRGRLERQVLAPSMTAADSFLPQNALTKPARDRLVTANEMQLPTPAFGIAFAAFSDLQCTLPAETASIFLRRANGSIQCPDPTHDIPDVPREIILPIYHVASDRAAMAVARELANGYQSYLIQSSSTSLSA